jgi:hypothetical protein
MSANSRRHSAAARAICLAAGLAITASAAAAATPGRYYESFAGIEIAAGLLSDPSLGAGFHIGNATNISVAGGFVYWQDGVNIYRSNLDFTGTTLFHNNGVAPTDFAVDPAHNRYYESFAGIEIAAGVLSDPGLGAGFHLGNASNIAIGSDGVYWQDGVNIYRSSFDFSSTDLFHNNGVAPSDLAIQPFIPDAGGGGVPEPAAWALMLLGVGLAGSRVRAARRRHQVAA